MADLCIDQIGRVFKEDAGDVDGDIAIADDDYISLIS